MGHRRSRSKAIADAKWRDEQRDQQRGRDVARKALYAADRKAAREAKIALAVEPLLSAFEEAKAGVAGLLGSFAAIPSVAVGAVKNAAEFEKQQTEAEAIAPKPDPKEVIAPFKGTDFPEVIAEFAKKHGIEIDSEIWGGVDLAKGESKTAAYTVTVNSDGTWISDGTGLNDPAFQQWPNGDNIQPEADPNENGFGPWIAPTVFPQVPQNPHPLDTMSLGALEAFIKARKAREGKAAAPILPATPPEPQDRHHREVDV